ncbi:MAG: DUF3656 domain-containing U32 family peptidase [Methanomicrobiales archaeon]
MLDRNITELLAPAGSFEALKAGVNAGADAVYLSGKKFGARQYAANFSKSQLKNAVDYAHLRDVKVYVTVNTLIKNKEIPEVSEYILWLYKIGVDAVIVQDLGLASLINEITPEFNLHASTQMAIHNLPGVEWAAEFGFKRVVLAREMTLSEIDDIGQKIKKKIELEIFGHGALCYSYSGRCLLSSFIGGRSGNRGMCAQPCRKPYKMVMGQQDKYGRPDNLQSINLKDKYLLSTRDLALYPKLDIISQSPIDSIKIEGRMRSPEYVAIVVNIYRQALDKIKNNDWKFSSTDYIKLQLAFNRMFTTGYFLERNHKRIMGRNMPGKRGIYIGEVIDYSKKYKKVQITAESGIIPEKGDGIVFVSPEYGKMSGMKLFQTPIKKNNLLELKVDNSILKGSKTYLNYKKSLMDEAKSIISGNDSFVPIDVDVNWTEEMVPVLTGLIHKKTNSDIYFEMKSNFKMEKAIKTPLTKDKIKKQIEKMGSTAFNIRNLKINYPGDLFLSISKLNQIRRDFIQKGEECLLQSYLPSNKNIIKSSKKLQIIQNNQYNVPNKMYKSKNKLQPDNSTYLAIYLNNPNSVEDAVKNGSKRIYLEANGLELLNNRNNLCYDNFDHLKEALNKFMDIYLKLKYFCEDNDVELIWKWPSIARRNFLEIGGIILDSISSNKLNEIMIGDLGSAHLISRLKPDIRLSAAMELNIWNNWSIYNLSNILSTVTLSPELSKKDIISLFKGEIPSNSWKTDIKKELPVQGNMESIITEDRLPWAALNSKSSDLLKDPEINFWGLKDSKKQVFPFYPDLECRIHILNSMELCLFDYIPLFNNLNVDGLVIDARNRSADYVGNILKIYDNSLKKAAQNELSQDHIQKEKKKIKSIASGGITKGNFLRDVN